MTDPMPRRDDSGSAQLEQLLADVGQPQLWTYALSLPRHVQPGFLQQLGQIDWQGFRQAAELVSTTRQARPGSSVNLPDTNSDRARRAKPPHPVIRSADLQSAVVPTESESARTDYRTAGEDLLRQGAVAAVLVAGGQGTRLGFEHPKGMFPYGPLSGKSLFQGFCEQLQALNRRYAVRIPYLVMTSDATHQQTVQYFRERHYFGLRESDVRFCCQSNLPAVDAETGEILLAAPDRVAVSPDGHGGLLTALSRAGLFRWLADAGIEQLYYHQVDNPAAIVCDAQFIGCQIVHQADVSTKVVNKTHAAEKMGLVVSIDGLSQIIEYSDLPPEVAAQTDARGRLQLWAGNTAMHLFRREFLESLSQRPHGLPLHQAFKTVPYWHPAHGAVQPASPNAWKFERFIFDVLPEAKTSLVVETNRAREFQPIKNRDGADSPATASAALQALYREWIRAAGGLIGDDVPVEIGPLVAMGPEDLRSRFSPGQLFADPVNWSQP
jgi:UDP-N-acetylglucosamine/UDP-N-acetylgalactosamine diphosphorylase